MYNHKWIPISIYCRVNRASASETVYLGPILGWVKPQTVKSGVQAFLLDAEHYKRQYEASTLCGIHVRSGHWAAWLEDQKIPLLGPCRGNVVNKM